MATNLKLGLATLAMVVGVWMGVAHASDEAAKSLIALCDAMAKVQE